MWGSTVSSQPELGWLKAHLASLKKIVLESNNTLYCLPKKNDIY
jgi:hypothetical protein